MMLDQAIQWLEEQRVFHLNGAAVAVYEKRARQAEACERNADMCDLVILYLRVQRRAKVTADE